MPATELDKEQRLRGGRQRENPTWRYVEQDDTLKIKCLVGSCSLQTSTIANMERHFSRHHPDEYLKIGMEKQELMKNREQEHTQNANKKRKKEGTTVLNGVQLSMQLIKDACVKLVTEDGRPFSAIEDEGLQDLIRPLLAAVPQGERVAISSESVRAEVGNKAAASRDEIRKQVAGKLICLKVDSVTRMGRSFLGINIQYVKEGKLELRTLAVKELFVRHTAINLKRVIMDVLWEYGISVANIYSFTCDNGSNMVKTGSLLREDQEEDYHKQRSCNSTPASEHADSLSDINDIEMNNSDSQESQEAENDDDLEGTAAATSSTSAEDDDTPLNGCEIVADSVIVTCVRCAAHTLQLAIFDALKAGNTKSVIRQMRALCTKLRTQNVVLLLRNLHLKKPVLDVETRWSSTVDMLLSLLPLKEFCKDYVDSHPNKLFVRESVWEQAESIVRALEPSKVATKRLQEEQLHMGDFFGAWLTCKLQTTAVDTPFAKVILEKMNEREAMLMNNDAFLAAIYMDPRYFGMLTTATSIQAEIHLQKVWARLEQLQTDPALDAPRNDRTGLTEESSDEMSPLEKLLAEQDSARLVSAGAQTTFNILPHLKTYRASPRLKVSANVLQYWEARRLAMPEMFQLATAVLAVPATQVSVERVFSGIKYILSDLRYNLSAVVVDDIMVIRYERIAKGKALPISSAPVLRKQKPAKATEAAQDSDSEESFASSPRVNRSGISDDSEIEEGRSSVAFPARVNSSNGTLVRSRSTTPTAVGSNGSRSQSSDMEMSNSD